MKRILWIIALLGAFILSYMHIYPVVADELDDIYKEKSQKEKQLSSLVSSIKQLSASNASLGYKISAVKKQLKNAEQLTHELEASIDKYVDKVTKQDIEILETKRQLAKRVSYIYVESKLLPYTYLLQIKDLGEFLDKAAVYSYLFRTYLQKIKELNRKQEYYRGIIEQQKKQKQQLKAQIFKLRKIYSNLLARQKLIRAQIAAKSAAKAQLVNEIVSLSKKAEEIIARKAASQGDGSGGGGNGSGGGGVTPDQERAGSFKITDSSGNVIAENVTGPIRLRVLGNGYFFVSPTTDSRRYFKYRDTLEFRKDTNVYVINELSMQSYIKGLGEIPSCWPIEAAKAQAVAARSYAIASFNKRSAHKFDVYDTPADQNYVGVDKELEKCGGKTSNWVRGVDATDKEVMLSGGQVIMAYFHSADGGHTLSTAEVWGGSRAYAQARSDRYSSNGKWFSYDNIDACYGRGWVRRSYWVAGNSTITYAWLEDLIDAAIYLKEHGASTGAQDAVACLPGGYCRGGYANFAFGKIKYVLGGHSINSKVGEVSQVVQIYNDGSSVIGQHSRYTKTLKIVGSNGTYFLDAQMFKLAYNLRSPGNNWLASTLYDVVKRSKNDWKFYSRGFGHRIGMSQFGACGRAYKGQSYHTILKAYYSSISFATRAVRKIRVGITKAGGNITTVYANNSFDVIDGKGKVIKQVPANTKINIIR